MYSYKAICSAGGKLLFTSTLLTPVLATSASFSVPPGFEDLAYQKQPATVLMSLAGMSLGNIRVSYNQTEFSIDDPQLMAAEIIRNLQDRLNITESDLEKLLSQPIARMEEDQLNSVMTTPVVVVDDDDLSVQLVLPATAYRNINMMSSNSSTINFQHDPGFLHRHRFNYSNTRSSSVIGFNSKDIVNLTGNTYFATDWYINHANSRSSDSSYSNTGIDEAALYVERDENRYKLGRQRSTDNYNGSLPSLIANSSFLSLVSFDGISVGYNDNYNMERQQGSATPIELFMPVAGTVNVFSQGRLIGSQNLAPGLQRVDTDRWPTGVYEVTLVSNLSSGTTETTTRRFSKQWGHFSSGKLEYLVQGGSYNSYRHLDPLGSEQPDSWYVPQQEDTKRAFGYSALAYTTDDGISLGAGALLDQHHKWYLHSGISVPTNFLLFDRVSVDGFIGEQQSYGYNTRLSKSLSFINYNLSYQKARYLVDSYGFTNAGLISGSDGEYISADVSVPLPGDFSLRGNYAKNITTNRTNNARNYDTASIFLNRHFALTNDITMSWDVGYSENSYSVVGYGNNPSRDSRWEMRLSLSQRNKNDFGRQTLGLSTNTHSGKANSYGASIDQDFDHPSFDLGSRYGLSASVNYDDYQNINTSLMGRAKNRFGTSDIGGSFSSGDNSDKFWSMFASNYSGFAFSKAGFAFGDLREDSALLVDAKHVPEGEFIQVRSQNGSSVIVPGGKVTTLGLDPYSPAMTQHDQLFFGDFSNALRLRSQAPAVHVLPGQSYKVKLSAVRNQTVIGRLLLPSGEPLSQAYITGGQALTNERGFFVADFVMESGTELQEISAKIADKKFQCPIKLDSKKSIQGVIQLNEVRCEVI